jgi:hypothetical protein
MRRKQFITLIGCLLACSAILLTLYSFSPLNAKIYRASFNRIFVNTTVVTRTEVLDLKYNSFYIAGSTNNYIYLGNWTNPFLFFSTNPSLTDTLRTRIKLDQWEKIPSPRRLQLTVDSPYFFLSHGIMPALFRGTLNDMQAKRFMPDSAFFSDAVPFGPKSFALRSYSKTSQGYELARELASKPFFEFNYDLLERQVDGMFCVEGDLHYNKQLNRLVYLYFYRNEYIVMDTSLNLLSRYHTIDTFSHAQIKIAKIESQNYSTHAAPALRINGNSCVYGNYLFVNSNLLANNEDEKEFRGSTVIDVYNIKNGTYSHSFYIKDYRGMKVMGFQVLENHLATLVDRYLVIYKFELNNLPQRNPIP